MDCLDVEVLLLRRNYDRLRSGRSSLESSNRADSPVVSREQKARAKCPRFD